MEYVREAVERDHLRDAIVRHRKNVMSAQNAGDYKQADRALWLLVGDLARGELV